MSRLITIGLLVAGLMGGCSGPEFLQEDLLQEDGQRFGLVSVSYEHDWTASGDAVLLTTTAQFVSYTALDRDQVASLLALPLDPRRDLPTPDQCKLYDLSVEPSEDMAEEVEEVLGNVELLEAGDLRIQTDSRTVTLSPRHFPWLLPFISGVIYGEAQTTLMEEESAVRVTSEGGGAVGRFEAQAVSPELPRLFRLGDQEPSHQIEADSGRDLEVRWQSVDVQPDEITYLALGYSKDKHELSIRCRPRDDGTFFIPRDMLSDLARGKATLELARLRRTSFAAEGLEEGELRVTMRDTTTVQFR